MSIKQIIAQAQKELIELRKELEATIEADKLRKEVVHA